MTRRLYCLILCGAAALCAEEPRIGNHTARYDQHGVLLPWTSWSDAIDREMKWYARCPREHGYPRFVFTTFMDGDYNPNPKRPDNIPAMQCGMGIISYLKYYTWKHRSDPEALETARLMGDYLLNESLTPEGAKYPRFTRSTGWRTQFPLHADSGSQADHPYEVQPDKGAIAGYALVLLTEATGERKYLDQALRNARVLVANMRDGDGTHSPWPFRVDYRTGEERGPVAANQSYTLRLFDKLLAHDYGEFRAPRERLWRWIKDVQIPNASADGHLWVQFFEDYDRLDNRNSWSAMSLARYLVEQKDKLDPEWRQDARALIEFTNRNFTSIISGITVCGEQTYDKKPWGGALSTYGAVLAMYTKATGSDEYKGLAYQALNYALYATNEDGCPRENSLQAGRGGWQEDAHTDKIHNYMDAIAAFPEWAN
jgi:hypothetical protein